MPVVFDTSGMEQYDERTWFDPRTGDQVSMTYLDMIPDLPAGLDDVESLRHHLAVETAEVGALIEAHVVRIDEVPTLFQLIKVPIPDQDAGVAFIAAFTVPKAECSVVLRIQCTEDAATGGREAAVPAADAVRPHPYAPELVGRLPWHAADQAEWDEEFPDHPLSRARTWSRLMMATARIDPEFARLPEFRALTNGHEVGRDGPGTAAEAPAVWQVPPPDDPPGPVERPWPVTLPTGSYPDDSGAVPAMARLGAMDPGFLGPDGEAAVTPLGDADLAGPAGTDGKPATAAEVDAAETTPKDTTTTDADTAETTPEDTGPATTTAATGTTEQRTATTAEATVAPQAPPPTQGTGASTDPGTATADDGPTPGATPENPAGLAGDPTESGTTATAADGPARTGPTPSTTPAGPSATDATPATLTQTVLLGLPIGGYLPLWLDGEVGYWRTTDPDVLLDRLGTGRTARSEIDNLRFRETAVLGPDQHTLFLPDRFRDRTGRLGGITTQLVPAAPDEAFAAADDRAMSELYRWLGEVVLAAAERDEFVAVETGGWYVPHEPVVLIMLRSDGQEWHSVVETSPVPANAPVWRDQQPVDGDSQLLVSPATERTLRAAGLLTRFAVATWPLHPFQLGLSFGPNPTLGENPTR